MQHLIVLKFYIPSSTALTCYVLLTTAKYEYPNIWEKGAIIHKATVYLFPFSNLWERGSEMRAKNGCFIATWKFYNR